MLESGYFDYLIHSVLLRNNCFTCYLMLHVIADAQGEETDPVNYSHFTWALRHPYRINYLFQIHEGKTVSDQLKMYLPNILGFFP